MCCRAPSRPYGRSPRTSAARHTPTPATRFRGTSRVKSPDVIARMRRAGAVAAEILRLAGEMVRPGITTDEIDEYVHQLHVERDAYPSPLNYNGFPKSVCTSANEVICHGIPDSPHPAGRRHPEHRRHRLRRRRARRHQRHVPGRRRRPGQPPARHRDRGVHVARHRGGQAGPSDQRHRPGDRGPRQGPPLRGHPGVHRPWHRRAVPLRHPGAALLRLAGVDGHATRDDVHRRADDQPRDLAAPDVGRRLDRRHRRRQAHGPVRAHAARHRRRLSTC